MDRIPLEICSLGRILSSPAMSVHHDDSGKRQSRKNDSFDEPDITGDKSPGTSYADNILMEPIA